MPNIGFFLPLFCFIAIWSFKTKLIYFTSIPFAIAFKLFWILELSSSPRLAYRINPIFLLYLFLPLSQVLAIVGYPSWHSFYFGILSIQVPSLLLLLVWNFGGIIYLIIYFIYLSGWLLRTLPLLPPFLLYLICYIDLVLLLVILALLWFAHLFYYQ